MQGIGVADDIVKGVKVGMTAAEAVTAGIPVVGEIVAVVGDLVQVGMSVAAISQNAVFNQNLAAAVATAQKPVTTSDLASMANTPSGQAQLLMYLSAMASTHGQPPPVTQPTMTLQQIVTMASSL